MKQLTCEMCGGTDLVKQDGIFVCQACGTKYSVEEARKLMIEGTVDVSGSTVKVDSSDKLTNLYILARRAKEDNNAANAQKYYSQIAEYDPNSWEAAFFGVYFTAINGRLYQFLQAVSSVDNCISSTFKLIKDNISQSEQKDAYIEVCNRVESFGDMLLTAAYNHFEEFKDTESARAEVDQRVRSVVMMWWHLADLVYQFFEEKDIVIRYYRKVYETLSSSNWIFHNIMSTDEIKEIQERLAELDPTFVKPKGCYVATAVYGSYDCPEVWTLRRYRDYNLAETWYGRAFIYTYYAISPSLVKWFGHTVWFKKMWKGKLDRMVKKLQEQGYESTPYKDIEWK